MSADNTGSKITDHQVADHQVAVVIVNWQRPADTLECLASLRDGGQGQAAVILVDNGSQDDSVEQVRKLHPEIEVLPLPRNLGFAGGYNAGIRRALETEATHIFLLNNDTTLEPGTIPLLVGSSWDVAVPKILYYDRPQYIWAAGCRWRKLPPSVAMNGIGKADGSHYDIPGELGFATGCALMVRREVLEATGGFDTDFENYMEDYDFCARARKAGFRLGYVPAARVWHKVSQTLGEYSPGRWRQQAKNTVLFYRKGNRFPLSWLWVFLVWVSLRELAKGHLKLLPAFWRGVREGFQALKAIEPNSNGERV